MLCGKSFFRATASGSASATLQPIMTRPKTEIDYCLTTIVREVSKAGLPRVFNGFQEIQRSRVFSVKTVQPLKAQHFIRMRLKTPTIDIAPVKLYPYVKKARRKLKCMSLRLTFARTSCTPMTHCVPMG